MRDLYIYQKKSPNLQLKSNSKTQKPNLESNQGVKQINMSKKNPQSNIHFITETIKTSKL